MTFNAPHSEEQRLLDEMRKAVAERRERRCFMRLRQIEVAQGRLQHILDAELAHDSTHPDGAAHSHGSAHPQYHAHALHATPHHEAGE